MSEKGRIRAVELKNSVIGAGTVAMLKEGDLFRGLVTVTHMTPAQEWVVISPFFSGTVTSGMSLNTIVIEDSTKRKYPLNSKQWTSVKQLNQIDTEALVEFEKKPYPFTTGLYSKICTLCESHFQGAKKQPICENCCEERTEAVITISPGKAVQKIISLPSTKDKEIARIAFEAAREDKTITFEDWYSKTN